jgi:hypothetical protein
MNDNTKSYVKWAIVLLLAAAAILAVIFGVGAQGVLATSSAVQVPVAVNTAIQIGIIALLTAGFTWVFKTFGWDFRGLASVIGLALSTVIVAELQSLINLIPAAWDPIVNTFLYFLVLILAPAGGLFLLNRKDKESSGDSLI